MPKRRDLLIRPPQVASNRIWRAASRGVEHHETDNADNGNEQRGVGSRARGRADIGVVCARRLLQRSRCCAYHHCADSRPRCCQKICRQKMAPAHAAFEVGATLVRRFWIPSIESRLSSLFAALGTRASPRAVLEAPTPPLWATVLFGNARSYRDLAPGKSITGKVVSWDRNGVIFPDPGPYAVSVEARWFESGQPLAAEASGRLGGLPAHREGERDRCRPPRRRGGQVLRLYFAVAVRRRLLATAATVLPPSRWF
jgi:hypothetical protein